MLKPPRWRQRAKRSLKKWDLAVSNFIAIIPPHSNCQILASCPRVEFIRAVSKLKKFFKKNENLRLVFTSLVKRRKRKFDVLVVCTVTAKKCSKKRDAHAKLLFCLVNPLPFLTFFFAVTVIVTNRWNRHPLCWIFSKISYIHSWHFCSLSNVPLSFPMLSHAYFGTLKPWL